MLLLLLLFIIMHDCERGESRPGGLIASRVMSAHCTASALFSLSRFMSMTLWNPIQFISYNGLNTSLYYRAAFGPEF